MRMTWETIQGDLTRPILGRFGFFVEAENRSSIIYSHLGKLPLRDRSCNFYKINRPLLPVFCSHLPKRWMVKALCFNQSRNDQQTQDLLIFTLCLMICSLGGLIIVGIRFVYLIYFFPKSTLRCWRCEWQRLGRWKKLMKKYCWLR